MKQFKITLMEKQGIRKIKKGMKLTSSNYGAKSGCLGLLSSPKHPITKIMLKKIGSAGTLAQHN